jgi:predicted MFS family arabinose efflux permease
MSMIGLGTVLLVSATTGRYGLAGAVAGAGSAGYALLSPLGARLVDRFGQHQVLRPLMLVFGAAMAGLIASAEARLPAGVLVACSVLAGAATPQIGSMVRARWAVILKGSDLLHAAFSLESIADEVIFVAGPVMVTALATEVYPALGVAVAAVTCVSGTLWLAAQRGTEPPAGRTGAEAGTDPRGRRRLLPARGLLTLVPAAVFFGAMLAAIDLSTVDFAQQSGHKPLAGLLLGGYALGSMVGGLWYGSRSWRAPLQQRFVLSLLAIAFGAAGLWVMPGLAALAVFLVVAGLPLSAMLICGFSLLEQQTPPQRSSEGMAWFTSAISVGTAVGSAVAGQLVQSDGARFGYVLAAACGAGAVLVSLIGHSQLT